ncbi:MAG: ATP-dependent Clp protease adaptor ClpS [bacterium]
MAVDARADSRVGHGGPPGGAGPAKRGSDRERTPSAARTRRSERDDPRGAAGGEGSPPIDPSKERDRGVATKSRSRAERPPRFKVILYNDDYTPMEFVVQILEKVFGKSPSAATQIMLQIHRGGMGVAGVYVLEVAETKSATVLRMAEERGYPLRSGVEKE